MLSTDSNVSILSVNNNLLLSGSNLLLTGNDNNISLNNSTLSIQGGLNKDVSINSNNNISITADEISINASFGINNILNLTASNKINITSNIDMNLSNIYNCSKIENDPNNSLNMTGGSSSLNSINSVTLNQTSSGSFIQLNNARMILATNTFLPIDILTDGDLNIKASASYGSQDMILTRTTGNKCEWVQRPILPLSLFFLGNFLASGSLGATRFLNASGQAMVTSGTQNSTNTIVPFRINPLNYPNIGLKVPKLKLIYTVITNNVLTGSNFTASLYNYTSSGINTGITISAGVIFGSSVNINNPSINSTTVSESVLFNLPVSTNNYVLGINSVGITTSFSYHIVSLEIVYN